MLHYLVMASLFVLAGGHLWWLHRRVVRQVVEGQDDPEAWDALREPWELFQAAPGPDAATCDHWEQTIRQRYEDAGAADQLPPR